MPAQRSEDVRKKKSHGIVFRRAVIRRPIPMTLQRLQDEALGILLVRVSRKEVLQDDHCMLQQYRRRASSSPWGDVGRSGVVTETCLRIDAGRGDRTM